MITRLLFLALLWTAGAAHALTAAEARAIASGESDARVEALNKATAAADDKTAAFLQALADDSVKVAGDKVFLMKDGKGYETMSVSIAPGVSTLAFWVAQQILDGKQVKKDLVVPFLRIDQDNLETNLANTQAGGVANVEYTQADAIKVIESAK